MFLAENWKSKFLRDPEHQQHLIICFFWLIMKIFIAIGIANKKKNKNNTFKHSGLIILLILT